jgi:hypothetical protein
MLPVVAIIWILIKRTNPKYLLLNDDTYTQLLAISIV